MTLFEVIYLAFEPILPPLYSIVRKKLLAMSKKSSDELLILDIGGRKSHYTIGVNGIIIISELPRESELQDELNLGLNSKIVQTILKRRSNIFHIVYDDMTFSGFRDESFDCVIFIEVLEHVENDLQFLSEVHRVLKPGGSLLMTTPNGNYKKIITNPDHIRHYTKEELHKKLSKHFIEVNIEYAVLGGYFRDLGMKSWSIKNPTRTIKSMVGNLVN